MKNCPNCGCSLEDNARQCTLCGYVFDKPEITDTYSINTDKPKQENATKPNIPIIIISIVCIILFIAVITLGYSVYSGNKNRKDNDDAVKVSSVSTTASQTTALSTTTTTSETTTTTQKTTTTKKTTTTPVSTTVTTTTMAQPALSEYSGKYSVKDGGDTHSLELNIDDSGYCTWTYSLLLPMHYISMSSDGMFNNNTLDFDNVTDDYNQNNFGYITLIDTNTIKININGTGYTLYR